MNFHKLILNAFQTPKFIECNLRTKQFSHQKEFNLQMASWQYQNDTKSSPSQPNWRQSVDLLKFFRFVFATSRSVHTAQETQYLNTERKKKHYYWILWMNNDKSLWISLIVCILPLQAFRIYARWSFQAAIATAFNKNAFFSK